MQLYFMRKINFTNKLQRNSKKHIGLNVIFLSRKTKIVFSSKAYSNNLYLCLKCTVYNTVYIFRNKKKKD